MKTSLAIVLAAAALMLSATVGLKSGEATARFDSYSNKSPGSAVSSPAHTQTRH